MAENEAGPGERIRAAASTARSGLSDRLGNVRRALMIKAILVAVAGIFVIAWPKAAALYLLWAIALLLIIDGIAGVLSLFRAGERGAYFFQGLISLAIGAVLILWPGATLQTLVLVFGVWAILNSIAMLVSLKDLDQEAPLRQAQKTVGIVLGVVGILLVFWPGVAGIALSWLVGIAALIVAAVLFWLSRRMDDLQERVAGGG
jgi:uncharacterized membrane protein HdeD (DUF308 family)